MHFAHWTYYQSPIGWLSISGNGGSIAEIRLMDETPTRFYQPIPTYLTTCVQELEAYFAGQLEQFTSPVDLRHGTEFQQKVWEYLCTIPYGHTTSYLKIARQLADDKSVRAVGKAVSQNPIGILVPCHRVIGSNGELTGFMWGLENKRWLLGLENPNAFAPQQSFF